MKPLVPRRIALVGEALAPQLTVAYKDGKMPPLLGTGSRP
jgi:hypothetical protein